MQMNFYRAFRNSGLDVSVPKMAAEAQTTPSVPALNRVGWSPTHQGPEHRWPLLWLLLSPTDALPSGTCEGGPAE